MAKKVVKKSAVKVDAKAAKACGKGGKAVKCCGKGGKCKK